MASGPITSWQIGNIQKMKIMASGPITSWQIDGETVSDFIFWAPKSLQMVTAAMELKDAYSLEESEVKSLSRVRLFVTRGL